MTVPTAWRRRPAALSRLAEYLRSRWLVIGAFLLSRVLLRFVGVDYDVSAIYWLPHYLDVASLEHDLFRSLWYLHIQPPVPNLLLGLALQLPFPIEATLAVSYAACGLTIALCSYDVGRYLGLGHRAAVLTSMIIVLSPDVITWENFGAYDYPHVAMVMLFVRSFGSWATSRRPAAGGQLVIWGGVLLLTRAMLNPVWYVCALGIAFAICRPVNRRRAMAVATIPLLLWGAVVVKNGIVLGDYTTNSWTGINLIRISEQSLPHEQRLADIASGLVAPVTGVPVAAQYSEYEPYVEPCTPMHPDLPVIGSPTKSGGHPNANYDCMRPVYHELSTSARAALWAHPSVYPVVQLGAWHLWAMPASISPWTNENRTALGAYDRLWQVADGVVYVPLNRDLPGAGGLVDAEGRAELGLTYLALLGCCVVLGVIALRRVRRGDADVADRVQVFVTFVVVSVVLIGNLAEVGENYRFRLLVQPLLFLAGAVALSRWRSRRTECHRLGLTIDVPG